MRTMDRVDLHAPGMRATPPRWAAREVQKLNAGFNNMLARLEEERRQAGRAVLRGQEQERSRIAQDLHDEVNQALTGDPAAARGDTMDAPSALRPELQETKRLANQAMEELLHLARQLRPTALDDHGLIPALASQVEDFSQRTRHRRALLAPRPGADAHRRGAARHLPRDAGEPLQHRPARERQARDRRSCRSSAARSCGSPTTATASTPARASPGATAGRADAWAASACRACASARCSSAATSPSTPRPGEGTTIELTMGAAS